MEQRTKKRIEGLVDQEKLHNLKARALEIEFDLDDEGFDIDDIQKYLMSQLFPKMSEQIFKVFK